MVEILEYCLVVMVSTLFIAGSVATYGSFSSFESALQQKAAFAAVSGLASRAIQNGTSEATLSLPSSTIGCEGGSLSLSSGTFDGRQTMPVACDFSINVTQGPHLVRFTEVSDLLSLSVT